jgi:CelD/BcsL family acetyltransferase involved in cellulose biosynthesis
MVEISEIRSVDELSTYRLAWNSWLSSTPRATFVNTIDWLESYWQHFGEKQQLRVLVARHDGAPVGLLPLCIRKVRHRLGSARVLTYPLDGWGSWYGPVGVDPAVTMLGAMRYLQHARRDWDLLDLPWTAPPSRDGCRVARSLRVVGMLSNEAVHQTVSHVDFAGGFGDYLCRLNRKSRHELRRVERRVFEQGNVEYIRHRPAPAREGDGDPRWDLYAMCQQVALASWQSSSTTGTTLTHDRVRHFLSDAHEVAARNGMVDVNLLLVDGRPAAFAYNYHYHGRLTGIRVGYDPTLGIAGLGTALVLRSIEDSCERGDASLDLGAGETQFKKRLRTHSEPSYRVTYAPLRSWRSQAVRFSRWSEGRFTTLPNEIETGKAASA